MKRIWQSHISVGMEGVWIICLALLLFLSGGCVSNEDLPDFPDMEEDVVMLSFNMAVAKELSASAPDAEDMNDSKKPDTPKIRKDDVILAVFGNDGKLVAYHAPLIKMEEADSADDNVSSADNASLSVPEDVFKDNSPLTVVAFANLDYLSNNKMLLAKGDNDTPVVLPSLKIGETQLDDFNNLMFKLPDDNSKLEYLPLGGDTVISAPTENINTISLRSRLARIEIDDELPGGYYIESAKLLNYNSIQSLLPTGSDDVEEMVKSEKGYNLTWHEDERKFIAYVPSMPLGNEPMDELRKIELKIRKQGSVREETRTLYIAPHVNKKPNESSEEKWLQLMPNHSYCFKVVDRAISNTIRIAWYKTEECNNDYIKNTLENRLGKCSRNKFTYGNISVFLNKDEEITIKRIGTIDSFKYIEFDINEADISKLKEIFYKFLDDKGNSWIELCNLYDDSIEFWKSDNPEITTFYLNERSYRSTLNVSQKYKYLMPNDKSYRLYFKEMEISKITLEFGYNLLLNRKTISVSGDKVKYDKIKKYQYVEVNVPDCENDLLFIEYYADREDGTYIDDLEENWIGNCDIFKLWISDEDDSNVKDYTKGKYYYVYYFN